MDSTTEIILKIIGWVLAPFLSFLVGWLASRVKKSKKQKETEEIEMLAIKEALKAVLKNILRDDHEFFTAKQRYCSPSDKQEVEIVYQCYHKLGGNGLGTQFRNDILSLPDSDTSQH